MNTAVCRLCRREGIKLFLKGNRCLTSKCALEKKPRAPGNAAVKSKKRSHLSAFGKQLRTKQSAKRIYGLREKIFKRYYQEAIRQSEVPSDQALPQIIESRLDNVVYKSGIAKSRRQARQMITHGHFTLNSRGVKTPSILVKIGDKIKLKDRYTGSTLYKDNKVETVVTWMNVNEKDLSIEIVSKPKQEEFDFSNVSPILEFYSAR